MPITKAILFILVSFIASNTYSVEHAKNALCEHYNWSKVEALVEPYLNETLMTALIQQGNSAEYHTAAAADQALVSAQFPPEIETILVNLITLNCE